MRYTFPKNFNWGVATAAAQIEGAAFEDGKGASIWDVFSRIPGRILNGDTPDIACNSYHLYPEDIALMKKIGIRSYRFSFSWPRLLPDGTGNVNQQGLDYYRRLIDSLKEAGIKPNATLYHWDLPYSLQLKGGFGNRDIVNWFKSYAEILFDAFGDDIDYWVTFNEPIATYVGYGKGFFAPGLSDEKYARQALHNLLLCHGEAVKLFRSKHFQKAKIGIVVDVWKHYPARKDNAEDIASAVYNNECQGYGMFLHPLFIGGYSRELTAYLKEEGALPKILEGDFDIIRQPLDFYGLNFYNGLYDNTEEMKKKALREGGNYQDQPASHPEAIYDVLHMLVNDYGIHIPIMITENGLPQSDSDDVSKLLDDQERIKYLKQVLIHVRKAMDEGIDVRGYYLWSLMDNFEWTAGYQARYGIFYTDYKTMKIIPKKSAGWYSSLIRKNEFED
jgi:beta-glucosidase